MCVNYSCATVVMCVNYSCATVVMCVSIIVVLQ